MSDVTSQLAEARSRAALRASDLPFEDELERASSTHNEIHLTERYVVRVSVELNKRLHREGALYAYLPDRPWAPVPVASGTAGATEYLIVERKPGRPLAHAWPFLSVAGRRGAVADLATCLKAIHATPTPTDDQVPPLTDSLHLLDEHPASEDDVPAALRAPRSRRVIAPLLAGLDRLAADPNADLGIVEAARDYVSCHGETLDDLDDGHLIHGDLTFENLLHDNEGISAIVDYEWCRGAPPEADLDVLLRCCAMPGVHVSPAFTALTKTADYDEVPSWLAEDYPRLFERGNLVERLTIYAIAFDVAHAVTNPLPANRIDVDDLHPWNRLVSLVSSGGHVALLLDRVGAMR